ncbi:cytochrome P450 [Micromonospora sp. DT233]|uniref:cytochrome P450 n=1 Tax=Micromonospora sp. DT233 TaxID=3393432 RepID=UPI003CF6800A
MTDVTQVPAVAGIDLTDVDLFARGEHLDALARLRADDPVHWNEGADGSRFWALTKYDDVQWAYREHELFSSSRGAIVGGSLQSSDDTAAGRMLVVTDLPRHRLLKQVIQPALSSAVLSAVSAQVGALVDRAVQRLVEAGGGDFATEVATELPAGALMTIMDISHEDAHQLIRLTRRMVGYRDEVFVDTGDDTRLRLAWLQAEIFDFFEDLLAQRRRRPGDDVVSRLARSRINGRLLETDEILYNCLNLAVGGNETSSYTACTGLLALMENPAQYDRLLADHELLGTALDEVLRWSSTNAYVQRVAKRDVERRGRQIRAGDSVTVWNVSANRDADQFPDADAFDVGRTPNRHLSYGSGIHRCIGAPVAQAELGLLFRRLLTAGVRCELAGEPRRLRSNFMLGLTSLPVRVARAG